MTIDLTLESQVATLQLNTGHPLGLLTPGLLADLATTLGALPAQARVLVICTDGVKAFSAGANIKDFGSLNGEQMWQQWLIPGQRVFDQLAQLPIPTIAAVHAHAMGGGMELALACDLRIVADNATMSLPETGIGAIPGWGGVARLTELVGKARALELILTRRRLTAPQALQWGLATTVVPADELSTHLAQVCSGLIEGSGIAQAAAKAMIHGHGNPAALISLAEGFGGGLLNTTDDHAEGVAAFTEKRAPKF